MAGESGATPALAVRREADPDRGRQLGLLRSVVSHPYDNNPINVCAHQRLARAEGEAKKKEPFLSDRLQKYVFDFQMLS